MPAAVYNWEVEQGATAEFVTQLKDPEGNPVDLTGYSGRGQIREKMSSQDVLATITVNIENPAQGFVRITLPPSELAGKRIKGNSHSERMMAVYDIELYRSENEVIRLLNGSVAISPEVTRA